MKLKLTVYCNLGYQLKLVWSQHYLQNTKKFIIQNMKVKFYNYFFLMFRAIYYSIQKKITINLMINIWKPLKGLFKLVVFFFLI